MTNRVRLICLALLPACVAVGVWETAARDPQRAFMIGAPSRILKIAIDDFTSGTMWLHIIPTAAVAAAGLVLGTLIGTFVGFSLWINVTVGRLALPYVATVSAIPLFAVAPLVILSVGIGYEAKVIIATATVLFVALNAGYDEANRLFARHDEWLHGLNASRAFAVRHVIAPEAMATIFTLAKANVAFAILGTFVAEFMSSDRGLGFYILRASGLYDTSRVLLGVLTLGAVAAGLRGAITLIQRLIPAVRFSTPAKP